MHDLSLTINIVLPIFKSAVVQVIIRCPYGLLMISVVFSVESTGTDPVYLDGSSYDFFREHHRKHDTWRGEHELVFVAYYRTPVSLSDPYKHF